MSTTIRDRARGRWPLILAQLGVDKAFLVNKHGPCPLCGGADRFRFDDKHGEGTYYCNQCGAGNGVTMFMKLTGLSYAEAAGRIAEIINGPGGEAVINWCRVKPKRSETSSEQFTAMERLWSTAKPITERGIGMYLAGRGIGISKRLENLREIDKGDEITMVARVHEGSSRSVETRCCQLHRTILRRYDSPGVEKKLMPGRHPPGSAVRLFAADRDVLGVAEGIETALSAATMFQVPVWAALTAGRLATFVPPPGVKHVRIFADNDMLDTGLEAASDLARTLDKVGIRATIEMPPNDGTDWNDVLFAFMNNAVDAGGKVPEARRVYFRGAHDA